MNERYTLLDRLFQRRWLVHALFWAYILFSAPLFSEFNSQEWWESLIYRGVGIPIKMIAAYLLVYYQIPKLLQKKKNFQFLLSLAISVCFLSILYRINNIYIAETLAGATNPKEPIIQILSEFKITVYFYFWRTYIAGILLLLLKILKDWALNKQKMETLQKEKAHTELNFLKAQLHPHFLFNTLNNIYALALKKADETPEAVAKLSEILDYMLYQCNEDRVLIKKEIEILEDYLNLERLRYGNRLTLNFSYELEDAQATIAPLVLLSIVENAFKHGVSGTISNPEIDIELKTDGEKLYFRVYNTQSSVKQHDETQYRKGIGTANIQRQLQLLYPGQYTWEVQEESDSYEVILTLTL